MQRKIPSYQPGRLSSRPGPAVLSLTQVPKSDKNEENYSVATVWTTFFFTTGAENLRSMDRIVACSLPS